jgi:hypothetical protein
MGDRVLMPAGLDRSMREACRIVAFDDALPAFPDAGAAARSVRS